MKWGGLFLVLTAIVGCAGADLADVSGPEVTGIHRTNALMPLDILLPKTRSKEEATYLGLKGHEDGFRVNQIQAKGLVIEVFDMYCTYCQRQAPIMNAFYELTLTSGHGEEVKMIGIGRKNSAREVSVFQGKYKIRFPLFPDKDLKITKALHAAKEGTPHFIVLRMSPRKRAEVVYTRTGLFKDPQAFLDIVLDRTGLKKESSRENAFGSAYVLHADPDCLRNSPRPRG